MEKVSPLAICTLPPSPGPLRDLPHWELSLASVCGCLEMAGAWYLFAGRSSFPLGPCFLQQQLLPWRQKATLFGFLFCLWLLREVLVF